MNIGGYHNKVAWVDLDTGTIRYEGIREEDARKYVGGRGLGVKYVYDNGPGVEPLSPRNLLCVMTGPLTGTPVNMSGRLAVVTRSPLTGTVTDSHMGGFTAAKLRWAGFDGLVFRGRAARPTYALVKDGMVSLHAATDYWGLGVYETIAGLRELYGDDASVIAIGPAGENGVRFAAILNEDNRASGRGGTGAVMGSKNLKAIVIIGDKSRAPKPALADGVFSSTRKDALRAILEGPVTGPHKGGLSVYGTNVLTNVLNQLGAFPTRNAQTTHFEGAEAISGEAVKEHILVSDPTCHACPVACKKEVEVREGRWKVRVESFEYESAWALGAQVGNADREALAYMIDRCNDLGLDTIEMGNALAVAMEAYQKGLLAEKVEWGDAEKMVELIQATAYRRGLGDALAEGAAGAAKRLGDPDMAMSVKGQGMPAYDPRGVKGMGVSYATSNRGACHLRGYTVAAEVLGIPEPVDRLAVEGKGRLTKFFQDLFAFTDSLDICKFSSFSLTPAHYAALYHAVTGIPATAEDVLRTGERIYNLERHYNNLNGFDGKDDTLPRRLLTEPATGASAGQVTELDVMLREYYEARGWDNGVVPEKKLRELEIV